MNPARLDELFPDRHAVAEKLNLHPSLRQHFVPVNGSPLTPEQRDALIPPERRQAVFGEMAKAVLEEIHHVENSA